MTTDKIKIVDKIKHILVDKIEVDIPVEEIDPHDGFVAVLGLDSIGFIELRYQCEDVFDIKIADEDFVPTNFVNCAALSAYLAKRLIAA